MGEAEFLNYQSPRTIPRRNGLFLATINNFPYIMALPASAVILGMHLGFWLSLGLCLAAVGVVWVFWKSNVLNVEVEESSHPHHRRWGSVSKVLKPLNILFSKIPSWCYTVIYWFIVTFINLAANVAGVEHYLLSQFWLLYIPVVIWPGYRLDKKASEWFGAAWVASAVVYAWAYLDMVDFDLDWVVIGDLASHLLWFFFLSVFIHYLFRRLVIFRCQSEFLQQLIGQLREQRGYSEAFDTRPITSSPDEHLNKIAWEIGSKLLFERVFIHILDPDKEQLFMKGCYGKSPTIWPETGWSVRDQVSISGWVVQNKQAHLCGDTMHCSLFYDQDRTAACRSEAAVPIIVENKVVGLIDIESSHRNAFDESDVQLLWQIANSIGAALVYERHVSREVQKAYQLLEDTAYTMVTSRSLDEALEQIADQARCMFGADLVTIYKHAVSTRVPLPGLVFKGFAKYPELLGNRIPSNARVNDLLYLKDEIYIQPFAETDELLLGPSQGVYDEAEAARMGHIHRFVRREEIKSTVYIKLGLGQEVVGSLFLNYRQRTFFQKNQVNALHAFAKMLAMALILKRQVERANGPLAGAVPLSHSQAEAAFESASRKFNEIHLEQLAECIQCQEVLQELEDFSSKLEQLKREWNNLILVEQRHLRGSSLAEPITHLESKLRAMFPGVHLKWNVQEFLRIPTDEFGDVLYKVIAEAVSNALVHGEADVIEVKSAKTDNQIVLSIKNNGDPIQPNRANWMNDLVERLSTPPGKDTQPESKISRLDRPYLWDELDKTTGIVPILVDSWRWFGAKWNFSNTENGDTLISVTFPLGQKFILPEEEYNDAIEIEN